MAYPSNDRDIPLQFLRLGGLNQRISKHTLPAPEFSVLQGLYPAQDGLQERLPGIKPLALAGNGTAGIWQIFQPNDGTDNIIIQTSDGTERTYSLNELFGRTVVSDLIYTPLEDDEDMPTAIILQDAANGVDGPTVGASSNTWYQRELTSNPLNEDSIIVSFVSGAAGTFTLAPGDYRIRGFVNFYASMAATGNNTGTARIGFQAVLNNVTDGVTTSVGSSEVFAFVRSTAQNNALEATGQSELDDTFAVSGSNKTFNIQNAYLTTLGNATISALTGKASGITATLNGAAVRQPYLRLNISKIA